MTKNQGDDMGLEMPLDIVKRFVKARGITEEAIKCNFSLMKSLILRNVKENLDGKEIVDLTKSMDFHQEELSFRYSQIIEERIHSGSNNERGSIIDRLITITERVTNVRIPIFDAKA